MNSRQFLGWVLGLSLPTRAVLAAGALSAAFWAVAAPVLTVYEGKPLWLGLLVGAVGVLIIAACAFALLYVVGAFQRSR